MRVLVTGSSGQIGSYAVDVLGQQGHEAAGFDLRPSRWTTTLGDIRDADAMVQAARGCDAVIHCAAQVSVQASVHDPASDASSNILGTIQVLRAARAAGARVVNVSSAAVYGDPVRLPIEESHPLRPRSPYGASKLAAEHYARLARELHGSSVVTVRPFNVYSPRQDPQNPYSGVLSKFVARIRTGEPPRVFGDGSQTRDFVHARDVARWLVELALDTRELPEVLNLGTARETSILELARTALRAAGLAREPEHAPALRGEIARSVADVSRASDLGLRPTVALEEGVKELFSAQPADPGSRAA